jgi:hypothetical protein
MTVRRGVCIRDKTFRAPELARQLLADYYIRNADGQVILPRGTRWHISQATADVGNRVIRVTMDQLLPSAPV